MKKPSIFILGAVIGLLVGGIPTITAIARWYFNEREPAPPTAFQNAVLARAPFDGKWFVSWGGENKRDNQHFGTSSQALAIDIRKVIEDSGGQTMSGDPQKNASYGCWAQPIYSPIDGIVEVSVDGVPDNIPGELNRPSALGNYVMVRSASGFVVVLAHFKQGSVAKPAGAAVKAGELLGQCGNSGNSTEPHLHLHVQSGISMERSVALRMVFPYLTVGGIPKENHSPIRGEIISHGREESKSGGSGLP
jgi:hypothetical protein